MQTNLISSPQELTASWVDLGEVVDATNWSRLFLWIDLDINDSQNVRVRALPKIGKNDTSEYNYVIETVGSSDVKIEPKYFEFNSDSDQKVVWQVNTLGGVPYVQFQVEAGTAGATPGQIETAIVTASRKIN